MENQFSKYCFFTFQYAILLTSVFMISTKYILHTMDLRNIHPWENKAVYLLYSELVLGKVKNIQYCLSIMMKFFSRRFRSGCSLHGVYGSYDEAPHLSSILGSANVSYHSVSKLKEYGVIRFQLSFFYLSI